MLALYNPSIEQVVAGMIRRTCLLLVLLGHVLLCESFSLTSEQSEEVQVILEGRNLTLRCEVEGRGSPVAWYFDNEPLETNASQASGYLVEENGRLTVFHVSRVHAGWYTCASSSNDTRSERDFLVFVEVPPSLATSIGLSSYPVLPGTKVDLPCHQLGIPLPTVSWFDSSGNEIMDGQRNGRYRIDPVTHSLVIFDVTQTDVDLQPFFCRVTNDAGTVTRQFNTSTLEIITSERTVVSPDLIVNGVGFRNTSLSVARGERVSIGCTTFSGLANNTRYRWTGNDGVLILEGMSSPGPMGPSGGPTTGVSTPSTLLLMEGESESGIYCCQAEISGVLINTHCLTVIFPIPPRLDITVSSAVVQAGRTAGLVCYGSGSSILNYDPPVLSWTGPAERRFVATSVSERGSVAYMTVQVTEDTSGTYICEGDNVGGRNISSITLQSVALGGESFVINGLAEVEDNINWKRSPGQLATITSFRNEGVFMLSFNPGQGSDLENIWLEQKVQLPSNVQSIYVRGRMRQSEVIDGIIPAIELSLEDRVSGMLPSVFIPRVNSGSLAWQWVGRNVAINSTVSVIVIRLVLIRDNSSTASSRRARRQVEDLERGFFDDISLSVECEVGFDFCPDLMECRESCEEEGGGVPVGIIVAGSVAGGVVALLCAAVVLLVCVWCCCCKKSRNDARPMSRLAKTIKKVSFRHKRHHYYHTNPDTSLRNHQQTVTNAADYQVPQTQPEYSLYESLKATSGDDGTRYENISQGQAGLSLAERERERGKEKANNGQYAALDPQSINQDTYYTSRRTPTSLNTDLQDQERYLNVIRPPGGSPLPLPPPPTSPKPRRKERGREQTEEATSPDVLDGEPVDPYDYINADLGPNSN